MELGDSSRDVLSGQADGGASGVYHLSHQADVIKTAGQGWPRAKMTQTTEANGAPIPEGKDFRCGAGGVHPACAQSCANIKAFVLNLSFLFLANLALFSYLLGVLRTVEKRFSLSSTKSGVLLAIGDIVQTVVVIFVGYFGRKTHKPRYLSLTAMCSVLGAFMCSVPYFIYGAKDSSNSYDDSYTDDVTVASYYGNHSDLQICSDDKPGFVCGQGAQETTESEVAFILLVIANLLLGFGTAGIGTLGMSFIDENVKAEDSGLYIGMVSSMFMLGPIIGFSMAAACTSMPENLVASSVDKSSVEFIGAWWLGTVVIGCLIFIVAIPLFFFPKHFPIYYQQHKKAPQKKRVDHNQNSLTKELKEFPKSLWRLLSNVPFLLVAGIMVFFLYLIVGIVINMPRYMEIHFRQPAYISNIATAFSGAISGALGNILGGLIMKRLGLRERGSSRMLSMAMFSVIIGVSIMMSLGCPEQQLAGGTDEQGMLVVDQACNNGCFCSRDDFQPVCSEQGVLHFSPCHAGCQQTMGNQSFTECTCLESADAELSADACRTPCGLFYPYIITYVLMSFCTAMSRVPAIILVFRLVDEEMKAFALGIASCLYNLLVFVPGPVIYGAVFDSACLLWESNCGEKGACLLYDTRDFRLYMHGLTLAIVSVGFILTLILIIYIERNPIPRKEIEIEINLDNIKDVNGKGDSNTISENVE